MVSLPVPPVSESSPLPPLRVSLPAPPMRVSLLCPPMSESLRVEPVIFVESPRLVTEIARSFPYIKVRPSSFNLDVGYTQIHNDFDLQIPMGSLPKIFRKKITDFSSSAPYLIINKNKAEIFERKMNILDSSKIRVGICWRSGFQNAERNISYTELTDWEPIFKLKNLEIINLQYGECENELLLFSYVSNCRVLILEGDYATKILIGKQFLHDINYMNVVIIYNKNIDNNRKNILKLFLL